MKNINGHPAFTYFEFDNFSSHPTSNLKTFQTTNISNFYLLILKRAMNNSQDDVMLRGSDEFGTATYHISSFHCIMIQLVAGLQCSKHRVKAWFRLCSRCMQLQLKVAVAALKYTASSELGRSGFA